MKVSVVVPVYNPGPYIQELLDSLRAQTLDAAEWEAVFVDDGSTDGTPALLAAAAAEQANFRVIRIPNSGWPGRPRNVGLDAAQGEYVFLSDHDDRLDPAALQRLTAFADEHGSDVVVGKMVGVGRNAPVRIFDRTVVDAQADWNLLFTSLTPQKLYRRAFLDARDIRFPEGRRRLEDHLFVTKALLRAGRVSIYADFPIYYFLLRDDGRNASRRKVEWRGYFANAAESIRVVDAEAPDDASRVVIRQRWLRAEAMTRVHAGGLLKRDDADRAVLLDAVRDLIREYYPLEEIDRLGAADRIAARLLLADRDDDLLAFSRWEASTKVRPALESARFADGALEVRIRADRHATAERPAFLDALPAGWPTADEVARMEGVPPGISPTVTLLHRASGQQVDGRVDRRVRSGVLEATGVLPLAAVQRQGSWVVVMRFRGVGRSPVSELKPGRSARPELSRHRMRSRGTAFRLTVGDGGRLLVMVSQAGPRAVARRVAGGLKVRLAPRALRRRAGRLLARLRRR